MWESILEVHPVLGQCRVILQQRAFSGYDCSARTDKQVVAPDHSSLSVRLCGLSDGHLHLRLQSAPADSGMEDPSAGVRLRVGDTVKVHADSLRCHTDHLCLTLGVPEGSRWLAELVSSQGVAANDELQNVHCRRCSQLLMEEQGKSSFMLPTNMWQVSAEVVACEECMPLGTAHVRAAKGRVYISAECLLVAASDLCEDALCEGEDGLMYCNCGFVVGESSGASSPGTRNGRRRPSARPVKNLCRQGWRSGGARRCASAAVSLYKHRVSMPRHSVEDAATCITDVDDLLAPYLEAAAVGAQLLSLRATAGHSRFVLMPSRPVMNGRDNDLSGGERMEFTSDDYDGKGTAVAALELRILAPELLIVGPTAHCHAEAAPADVHGILAHAAATDDEDAQAERVQRAAKVCFRPCSCEESATNGCLVVVPHLEFEAVCQSLDVWASSLPLSVSSASPLGAAGQGWRTSYLLLPPRDLGLC